MFHRAPLPGLFTARWWPPRRFFLGVWAVGRGLTQIINCVIWDVLRRRLHRKPVFYRRQWKFFSVAFRCFSSVFPRVFRSRRSRIGDPTGIVLKTIRAASQGLSVTSMGCLGRTDADGWAGFPRELVGAWGKRFQWPWREMVGREHLPFWGLSSWLAKRIPTQSRALGCCDRARCTSAEYALVAMFARPDPIVGPVCRRGRGAQFARRFADGEAASKCPASSIGYRRSGSASKALGPDFGASDRPILPFPEVLMTALAHNRYVDSLRLFFAP
ncbi:MAG: hypothetical protein ACI8TX_000516 [Hyphomicrobiaceae bacterium]|jgi:hypothetical protein